MTINCIFLDYKERDEKTGDSVFEVLLSDETKMLCKGITINYMPFVPLVITGENSEEDSVFLVSDVYACGYNEDIMKKYLVKYHLGIGDAIAKKLISKYGSDLFSFADSCPDISSCGESEKAISCLWQLKATKSVEKILSFIKEYGGEYNNALCMFNKYGHNAISFIKENPYSARSAGLPYQICEMLAKEKGIEACDKQRLSVLIKEAVQRSRTTGSTWLSFESLCNKVSYIEKKAKCGYTTERIFIAETILSPEYKLVFKENDVCIYRGDDYKAEFDAAFHLHRIYTASKQISYSGISVEDIEKDCGISYSDDQKKAFDAIKTSGIKIITGGPGTGKTTLLKGLLDKFGKEHPEAEIALCAPTGCAATRMKETTGRDAYTIHHLLGIVPYMPVPSSEIKLTADLVVVDESSMIDTYLLSALLKAIKSTATVLFIGDKDQLPSVGIGDIFKDMIMCGLFETYILTTVFRSDDLIIQNSRSILEGSACLKTNSSFKIERLPDEESLLKKVAYIAEVCKRGDIDFKVYTPSRASKFQTGSINLNRLLKNIRRNDESAVTFGSYRFSKGDIVLFNNNNSSKGYYNGLTGTVLSVCKEGLCIYMTISTEQGDITLNGSELEDVELGYAMTAHKSQGGETRNALIVIPQEPASLLLKRLLYVEVTRAKKGVYILTEGDALEKAIANKSEAVRNTGLVEKLREFLVKA